MSERLTNEELAAFAGIVRCLVRLDGKFTEAEAAAIDDVANDLLASAPGNAPYREEPEDTRKRGVQSSAELWALIDRAGEDLEDDAAVRRLAVGVTRPEARELIYEALFAVAASDVIEKEEWPLLDWLAKEWKIQRPRSE